MNAGSDYLNFIIFNKAIQVVIARSLGVFFFLKLENNYFTFSTRWKEFIRLLHLNETYSSHENMLQF